MSVTTAIRHRVSATDPGRTRLRLAAVIATGMLLSALGAWAVVRFLSADPALLMVGISMAMQMGLTPRDRSARARCATTALLMLPTAAAATAATLLAHWRPVEIAVLVAVTGVATWVRRFGPRATALGFAGFFGYFFPLLLKLTPAQLPSFLLVAAIAVGSLTLMRATLIVEHPRRQLDLLLRELRDASSAALAVAQHPDARRQRALRARLARLDGVARAITTWQRDYDTATYARTDETTFAARVLDARIDVEQACAELVRTSGEGAPPQADPAVAASSHALNVVLDSRSSPSAVADAAFRAQQVLRGLDASSPHRVLAGRFARGALAHAALRDVLRSSTSWTAAPDAPAAPPPARAGTAADRRWWQWRHWQPTTRLTVQAMVATTLATGAGEAISASRWYWAVLTAFVVFVGATTRGAILTRAYNRILGTAAGLGAGVVVVFLIHDSKPLVVAVCVVSAFGMMYFGPLRYLYSAFFTTTLLVSLYALLGDLSTSVLELRIDETVAGAAIGVLCAYLIFSATSHPALLQKVGAYFDALDGLLAAGRTALTTAGKAPDALASTARLQSALNDLDTFAASMSAAMIGPRRLQRVPVVHLLYVGDRAAGAYAAAAVSVTSASPAQLFTGEAAAALDDALARVRGAAARARASFDAAQADEDAADTAIIDELARLPFDALTPQALAIVHLSRIAWVMEHVVRENADR